MGYVVLTGNDNEIPISLPIDYLQTPFKGRSEKGLSSSLMLRIRKKLLWLLGVTRGP
jgi:hypothetical protein